MFEIIERNYGEAGLQNEELPPDVQHKTKHLTSLKREYKLLRRCQVHLDLQDKERPAEELRPLLIWAKDNDLEETCRDLEVG